MKKKYRLLDRNLIRHFGKVDVMLEEGMGERFVRAGKATDKDKIKMTLTPPSHKAVFQAPEDKIATQIEELGSVKYPGPEDKLFPHIEK